MTQRVDSTLKFIQKELSAIFEKRVVNGQTCFYNSKTDDFFNVFALLFKPDNPAIIVEYAKGDEEAQNNLFEDGDSFFLADMTDEEILKAVIAEIEGG